MPPITDHSFAERIPIRRGTPPASEAWRDSVWLAVLGDLMLAGEWDEVARSGAAEEAFCDLTAVCANDDLVFAKLEVTVDGDDGLIPREPRIIGEPAVLVSVLATLGVDVACLANNHAFDGNVGGFLKVLELLKWSGILHLRAEKTWL